MGTHYRRIKLIFFDIARISNHHVAYHTQPLDIRIQRTNTVGQVFRQHRNNAAREIHAGSAFQRIVINSIIRTDIMANVGNRHHQPVISADFFGKHSIVKIARRFAIYRYQRQIAQVHPAFQIAFAHMIRDFFRGFPANIAKLVRQMMFADGDFDFHTAVGIIA